MNSKRTPTRRPPLSPEELADVLGVSRSTVYRRLADGTLSVRTVKIGRQIRIPQAEVDRLLGEDGAA